MRRRAGRRRVVALTLGVALGGVGLFRLLGLPLPWLLGPMFACLAAALAGLELRGLPRIGGAMRTVLGLAVGASITPAVVARLDEMAASLALIPPFVALSGLIGYPWFRRRWGFDRATSFYAAMPGGLQDMLVFGIEAGADPRALSLIHATRVLVVVTILPVLMTWVFALPLDSPPGAPAAELPALELIAMVVIAAWGWAAAAGLGLFGAAILGPMILAAAASLSGIIHARPPAEAILAAQFFIGLGVGVDYVGVTAADLRRSVAAALGFVAFLGAASAAFALAVHAAGLAPLADAALAFAPGGQGEMAVLAIVAGADLAYVVTHHLARLVVVIVGAPLAGRRAL